MLLMGKSTINGHFPWQNVSLPEGNYETLWLFTGIVTGFCSSTNWYRISDSHPQYHRYLNILFLGSYMIFPKKNPTIFHLPMDIPILFPPYPIVPSGNLT